MKSLGAEQGFIVESPPPRISFCYASQALRDLRPCLSLLFLAIVFGLGSLPARATDLAGTWVGEMRRGSSVLPVRFDFRTSPSEGTFTAPDLGAIEIPLAHVLSTATPHWELVGDASTTIFDGKIVGGQMTGAFREGDRPGSFALHKISSNTVNPYTTEEVQFTSGATRLSGTLYAPRSARKHPAIVFLHGSGPEGRWSSRALADYVARRGIVALIYDKRGVGKSTGDWKSSSFQDLAADGAAGAHLLSTRGDVNSAMVGVYGHSQGGEVAPIVAQLSSDVHWIIAADGPVGPQYEQDLYRVQNALAHHHSGRSLENAMTLFREFVNVARNGSDRTQLYADEAASAKAPWYDDLALPDDSDWIWSFYKINGNFDSSVAWKSLRVPALLLFGGNDLTVSPESIKVVKSLVPDVSKVTARVFPEADHTLHIPPLSADGWPRLPAGFPKVITDWVSGLDGRPPNLRKTMR